MHRLPARELATKDRPLGSGRCHLKGPAPCPRTPAHGKDGNSPPLLDARVALQPCLDGSSEAGLRTFNYLAGKWHARTVRKQMLRSRSIPSGDRAQLAHQFAIDQWNPHFEAMCHASPIRVTQQLIAHIER